MILSIYKQDYDYLTKKRLYSTRLKEEVEERYSVKHPRESERVRVLILMNNVDKGMGSEMLS